MDVKASTARVDRLPTAAAVLVAVLLGLALVLGGPTGPADAAGEAVPLAAEGPAEDAAADDEGGAGSGMIVLGLLAAVALMGISFARISAQD